jgi:hypothetical protein
VASSFVGLCDAVIDDLTTEVPELRDALIHRYAPWDPEQLMAEAGERHLAVWPAAEAADASTRVVTGPGGDMLEQLYRVAYWEHAGDEASRGIADTEAAADLLNLAEKVRARFYDIDNVFLAGSEDLHYLGTSLPERSGEIRWFQITIQVRTSLVVT